jgi:hypothetical protein
MLKALASPVEICEALNVQHVYLINEQHTRHQLSDTCRAMQCNATHTQATLCTSVVNLVGSCRQTVHPASSLQTACMLWQTPLQQSILGGLCTIAEGQLTSISDARISMQPTPP